MNKTKLDTLSENGGQKEKTQKKNPGGKRKKGGGQDVRERLFCCDQCGKVAKTKQALERHAAYHNSDRPFSCEMCEQRFKNSDDLGKHLRRLRRDGKYEHACKACHKHFKSHQLLVKHVEMLGCEKEGDINAERSIKDTDITQTADDKNTTDSKNVEIADEVVKCVCKDCEEEFSSPATLKQHYKDEHKDSKRHVCRQCGQTLSSKDSLMRHYSIFHQSDYPYQCEFCQQKFKVKESLCRHVKFVHKDGGYRCEVCQRLFSQPVNLKKHMAVHSVQKEFSCDTCGKEFRWKQSLQKHLLLHPDSSKSKVKSQMKTLKSLKISQKVKTDMIDIELDIADVKKVKFNVSIDPSDVKNCVSDEFHTLTCVDPFDGDTIDTYQFDEISADRDNHQIDNSEKVVTSLSNSDSELKRKFESMTWDLVSNETELLKKRKQDNATPCLKLDDVVKVDGGALAQKTAAILQKASDKYLNDFETNKIDVDFPLDYFKKHTDEAPEEIDLTVESDDSVQAQEHESDTEGSSLNENKQGSKTIEDPIIQESSTKDVNLRTYKSWPNLADESSTTSTPIMTFKPSSLAFVFSPTDRSKNDNISGSEPSEHNLSKISDDESSKGSLDELDYDTSADLNIVNKDIQKVHDSRPTAAPSPSGIGKFSLIKHMLSLQNEEHFDKSVFENPFKIKACNIQPLKRLAEMHKISSNGNTFNVTGKQNIPFQWLGLSIRKDQKVAESGTCGVKDKTLAPTVDLEAGQRSNLTDENGHQDSVTDEEVVNCAAKYIASEPAPQSRASEPAPQSQDSEPAPQSWASEPAAQYKASESAAESWASDPAAELRASDPATQYRASEPAAQYATLEPLFVAQPVNPYTDNTEYAQLQGYRTATSAYSPNDQQDQVALDLCCTTRNNRNGFTTIPIPSQTGTLNTATYSCPNNSDTSSSNSSLISNSQFQLQSKPVDIRRFCGFQAMKSLVQYSQVNQDKIEHMVRSNFSALRNPFVSHPAKSSSEKFRSSTSLNQMVPVHPEVNTAQSYQVDKDLLKNNTAARFFRSFSPSPSISSVTSSMSSGYDSSVGVTSSMSSGCDSSVGVASSSSVFSLPVMPSSVNIPTSVVPDSASALRFTTLVSVASSLHQTVETQPYNVAPLDRPSMNRNLYMNKSIASSNPFVTSSINVIDKPRMVSVPVTQDRVLEGSVPVTQDRMLEGSVPVTQDPVLEGSRMTRQGMSAGNVGDLSVLDILQATEGNCSGFQKIDHLLDTCIN